MAIDRMLEPFDPNAPNGAAGDPYAAPPDIEITVDDDIPQTAPVDGMFIEDTPDGGVDIDMDPQDDFMSEVGFYENLAEYIDESEAMFIGGDLISKYEADKLSRKDWEETYQKGLELLGTSIENRTEPWDGACGITHPLLAEAIVRFQSHSIGEIFPAAGPCRTKIVGVQTPEKQKQANRIKERMNYLLTEEMEEYRDEKDKGLFYLAYGGSVFYKLYWSEVLGRPVSELVPAEDLVVPYGAKTLESATRISHRMEKAPNEVRKLMTSGFYKDVEWAEPVRSADVIRDAKDKMIGISEDVADDTAPLTLLEMHVELDLEGFEDHVDGEPTGIELPYIVTIDYTSQKVFSIYRNYLEEDPNRVKRRHFVHHQYIPGMGFYAFGLVHLIGGIASGSTSMLRQLVDAGTLSNLPGGFKSRNLRIKGDQTPIAPGEFRDVDVMGSRLQDSIMPLPYKEPSQVLAALLGSVVEEGRRFASLTDINISSMNSDAPVGTTLALLERNLKVTTAINTRTHYSMAKELKILANLVADNTDSYPYDMGDEEVDFQADFDGAIDVIPVSDPNSSTMAQKIMRYQTAMQLSMQKPEIYKHEELHSRMLNAIEIQDPEDIIISPDDIIAYDPVTENQMLLTLDPIKAYQYQNHQAHIQTHMMGMNDPKIQAVLADSPMAQASMAAGMAHVTEHVAFEYRAQIEKRLGVPLPPMDQPLPPEIEVELSVLTSAAAEKLFSANRAQAADAEAKEQADDPIFQARKKELEIKETEANSRAEERIGKMQLEVAKLVSDWERHKEDREQEANIATARLNVEHVGNVLEAASRADELSLKERVKLADMVIDLINMDSDNVKAQIEAKSKSQAIDADFFKTLLSGNKGGK